jgi:hypothetical protein
MDGWIAPLVGACLVLWILVRRARRLFGRQAYSVPRIVLRLLLIAGIGLMFLVVLTLAGGVAPAAGLTVGFAVGAIGVALTRFEWIDRQLHYTPNMYVGIGVFSLLIGRLIYRVIRIGTMGDEYAGLQSSPLTAGILFVLLGFYFFYYAAVLIRGRILQQPSASD